MTQPTSQTLNEFDIIQRYFNRAGSSQSVSSRSHSSVIKSIGDDCAILAPSPNKYVVMSMDTVVSGRHFPEDMPAQHIGSRALCTSISDLAAMGAKPLWFTLGLTLPTAEPEWLEAFSQGLFSIADQYNCELIGGDTTKGPLTVTVQVHGEVEPNHVLRRDAAQVGDHIFVTGCLGDGAAGLAVLQQRLNVDVESQAYFLNRFYAPEPQIVAGQMIAPYAHSAIDISDGLLADAAHITQASHVDFHINVDQLPMAAALSSLSASMVQGSETQSSDVQSSESRESRESALQDSANVSPALLWALTGGDDYQLLFTVSDAELASIQHLIDEQGLVATAIGRVVDAESARGQVHCFHGGTGLSSGNGQSTSVRPFDVSCLNRGFQHFTS